MDLEVIIYDSAEDDGITRLLFNYKPTDPGECWMPFNWFANSFFVDLTEYTQDTLFLGLTV